MDSIANCNALINKYKEQLRELERCRGRLYGILTDLEIQRNLISKPELSSNTWSGLKAHKFDDKRRERLINSYDDLINDQFFYVLETIDREMTRINGEITMVTQQKSSLEKELKQRK
ncbi:YwqH-like family protein [Bacillus massilinigeriensis]|uniref:YwqH-like family protein n=1 Tax=Bacillus mediterraneensis TaxID=1805474 RepID=UPI0008F89C18|nr:DUF5082 family protein [Bacillus mediterraneensis]